MPSSERLHILTDATFVLDDPRMRDICPEFEVVPPGEDADPAALELVDIALLSVESLPGNPFFQNLLDCGDRLKWVHVGWSGVDGPTFGKLSLRGVRECFRGALLIHKLHH